VVWLPYGVDVDKAKNLIIEIFKEDNRILPDTITAWVDNLADWSVNIWCVWQVPAEKYDWLIEKELLEKIYKKLPEQWIDFPFPTYEILGKLELDGNKK
jgi:small-conductance mechanosensitive channel